MATSEAMLSPHAARLNQANHHPANHHPPKKQNKKQTKNK
jgi:hypothetical protein